MYSPSDFKILICDDAVTNAMILAKLCESEGFTNVEMVTDPRKVIPVMEQREVDLLLLDIEMPHMNGFEVMKQVRDKYGDEVLPILILTGLQDTETRNRALSEGATDFLNKPIDQTEVILRVKNLIKIRHAIKLQKNLNDALEKKVQERTDELNSATETLIHRLALAGELRDNETGQHIIRVGEYARLLAEKVGLPSDICFMINKAAPMHDIGKIGISDNILLKKDQLTDEERETMCNHTNYGSKLLSDHDSLLVQLAASIAKSHHEKWDGTGYPDKLSGESIPIEGRITAVSDVFDALTTERPYKKPWPIEKVIELLKEESGKSFDPTLIDIFIDNLDEVMQIKETYAD